MYSPPRPSTYVPRTSARVVRTGMVCAALAAGLLALVAVRWSPLMSLDRAAARTLHRQAVTEPGLVHVNRVLTDWIWDPWTMRALIAVAVIVLWWRGARLPAVWVAATSMLSTFAQQGLKAVVGRERPQWPDPVDSADYAAFPSGHTMSAVVTCGLLLWVLRLRGTRPLIRRASLVVAVISVAGVGYTRLYLGVHWMSDVLGGLLLGVAAVAFSITGFAACRARSGGGGAPLPRRS